MKNRRILLVAIAVLVITVVVLSGASGSDETVSVPSTPFDYSYNSETEAVNVTYKGENSVTAPARGAIVVKVKSSNDSRYRVVTVLNGDRSSDRGIWISGNESGVGGDSLESGEMVRIVDDGIDTDGDGVSGIERGDIVRIYYIKIETEYLFFSDRRVNTIGKFTA